MYQIGPEAELNPNRMLFQRFGLRSLLAFKATLAMASLYMASASGHGETVRSLALKSQAMQMMNRRLEEGPNAIFQDEVMFCIGILSVIEVSSRFRNLSVRNSVDSKIQKWSNSREAELTHSRALDHVLEKRGGMRGFRQSNQLLYGCFYWYQSPISSPCSVLSRKTGWTYHNLQVPAAVGACHGMTAQVNNPGHLPS